MLRANRVAIKTDIRNERSQAAIARLGAKREGVLRHQMIRPDGSLRDTVLFSVHPGGVAGGPRAPARPARRP